MRFSEPGVDGLRGCSCGWAAAAGSSEFVVAGFIACFDGDAMTSASFTGSGVSSGASGLPLKSSAHCVFLFPMRTDGACRECDRWWLARAFVFCE